MSDEHVVINSGTPWVSYAGDGAITRFDFTFPVLEAADLGVWVDGSKQTPGVDFTVDGIGASGGGSIDFASAPGAGTTVVILRSLQIARTSDFLAGSALRAVALNTELDRLTMIGQELQAEAGRALRIPGHDAAAIGPLPERAARAGRVLAFDDEGAPVAGRRSAELDSLIAVAGAEAGASAAATSAEASAAAAADSAADAAAAVSAVDADGIGANQQAAVMLSAGQLPPSYPAVPVLAHGRELLTFDPSAGTLHHLYRPTDSGRWHVHTGASGDLWVDLRMLGQGQEFRAYVRHGGSGNIVVDPGTGHGGTASVIGPFLAGEKFRIAPGECIRVACRAINGAGNMIADVIEYSFRPAVHQVGGSSRLIENEIGLYDGVSYHNPTAEHAPLTLPSGFMIATDATLRNFSFPQLSAAFKGAGSVAPPRIQLPDREYAISGNAGPFTVGEEVHVEGSGTRRLRVAYRLNDPGRIGLELIAGALPVEDETITGQTSGETATVGAGTTQVSDLPAGAIELLAHNPHASGIDLRVQWFNLEKI
ncbi:MAG: phage tail fiber protein [Minwuia sp.]|uniref:phage tail fiber domain-containing protein n=1 Tax=Minwuia sp. TaxID=2493630 RepID=UPI003A8409FF